MTVPARTLDFPRRYVVTAPLSERRITCPAGHVFAPDLVLRQGRGTVRCRQCQSRDLLLVAVVREFNVRVTVQVTREELDALDETTIRPGVELLWLVLQPLGDARFRP